MSHPDQFEHRLPNLDTERSPHVFLPSIDQLVPITSERSTFGECYFNKPFEKLEFGNKLRVVADVLRQSVLPAYYSDPNTETQTFTGDCHATTKLAIDYLKYLGVGVSFEYAMVNRRPFDPEEKQYSKHAILIVTDEDGSRWQLDSAPWMGYGYGTVCEEGKEGQIINDYTVMDDEAIFIVDKIKELRLAARSKRRLSQEEKVEFLEVLRAGEPYPHLVGFVGEGYAALALQGGEKQQEFADLAISLDPYRGANSDIAPFATNVEPYLTARARLHEYTENQCKVWEQELDELKSANDSSTLERQLQLSQWIVNERKFADPSLAKTIEIDGVNYPLTSITPRFLVEAGMSTAIIKPSADFVGAHSTVRELLRSKRIAAEYMVDPTAPTEQAGIAPLLYSHALAAEFKRSYTGTNTVMLVKAEPEELADIKGEVRRTVANRLLGRYVMWTDGYPIEWHPFSMNYLHTADNPQEAALHFMFGYPEYSVVTRWTYPNPALKKAV